MYYILCFEFIIRNFFTGFPNVNDDEAMKFSRSKYETQISRSYLLYNI